jgi:hypothetical protein
MAASRMIEHPLASHAAGTVNQTSALSSDGGWDQQGTNALALWNHDNGLRFAERRDMINYVLRSATLPISRVICSFAYSQRAVRKSMMRSIGFFPGYKMVPGGHEVGGCRLVAGGKTGVIGTNAGLSVRTWIGWKQARLVLSCTSNEIHIQESLVVVGLLLHRLARLLARGKA